jgi:hypothetical protein
LDIAGSLIDQRLPDVSVSVRGSLYAARSSLGL